jgi:hypothetical protein
MITVQITLYTLRHARQGEFAQASHRISGDNKYDIYKEIADKIERFAKSHGIAPSCVAQSSIWTGGDLQ